jgi:N-acetylneuraminate synthase
MFPNLILGLSDHTPGLASTLGAVSLGARMIEKHFSDDTKRSGPDHKFSMDPKSWLDMVERTRELENALGCGIKKVEDNEKETVLLQRRSIRATTDLIVGTTLTRNHLEVLRPCPADGLPPYFLDEIIGMKIRSEVKAGEHLRWKNVE